MTEETKVCTCSKIKKILVGTVLTIVTLSSITSAYFGYKSFSLLDSIVNGNSQAKATPADKETITKKYAKGQTMEKALETGKPIAVFFYADWCTYCKRFAPVFAHIIKKPAFKSNLAVAFVNCEAPENASLVREYNIQGFPTVYLLNPKTNVKEEIHNSQLFSENAEAELLDYFVKFAKK